MKWKFSGNSSFLLREYNKSKISLTPEQELEYIQKYQKERCPSSLNMLIRANLYIIIDVVFKNMNKEDYFGDLVNEGILAFEKAIQGYNPTCGAKLSVYSYYKINAAIKEFIQERSFPVTNKRSIKNIVHKFKTNIRKLDKTKQYTPDEILNATGISAKQFSYNPRMLSEIIYDYFDDKEFYDSFIFSWYVFPHIEHDSIREENEYPIEKIIAKLKQKGVGKETIAKIKKCMSKRGGEPVLSESEKELILRLVGEEINSWK